MRHHCGVSVQAITPAGGPIDAEVRVPASKSQTNRALCLPALAPGTSALRNALFGAALQALGIDVRQEPEAATIGVDGHCGTTPPSQARLFVENRVTRCAHADC